MLENTQKILASIGWPTDILIVDFETFFDKDYQLKKMSTVEYVMDKRFEVLGCGFATNDNPPIFHEYAVAKQVIENIIWDDFVVVGQHLNFDCLILKEKYGIVPKYTIDILNLARCIDARAQNNLAALAKRYTDKEKGDTSQFMGQHLVDCDREVLAEYCKQDVAITQELLHRLLPKTANPAIELPLAHHTLMLFIEPKIKVDFKLADELLTDMGNTLDDIISQTGYTAKDLRSNMFTDLVEAELPEGEFAPQKVGKNGLIGAFAKTDEGMQKLLNHNIPAVRELAEARMAAKSWPTHIKRVTSLINQARCRGGYLSMPLRYYGGHTGRWSGEEKINVQNLGSKAGGLIAKIRNMLIAPDGSTMIIADYASIEARVLAWLAGQDDLVAAFAAGADIYSDFATSLLHKYTRKAMKSDPDPVKKLLSFRRGFGKVYILGSGYGMGAIRNLEYMKKYPELRPEVEAGKITAATCKVGIDFYRKKYPKIPNLWTDIEASFRSAIKFENMVFGPANGKIHIWRTGSTVNIKLPSGRILYYPHCSLKQDKQYSTIHWHYGVTWGGSLVENIVQAVSRDLLAEAILTINNVVFHCHDETISLCDKKDVDKVKADVYTKMTTIPAWADGLPVDVEIQVSERYTK